MEIAVLGSNGFLGTKLCKVLSENHSVKGYRSSNLDITDPDSLRIELEKNKPRVLINSAGITDVDLCETNPELADRVNGEANSGIVRICNELGIKLIYFSTDFVFDGNKGEYEETDNVNPINNYGKSKLLGERIISERSEDYLILRTAILYGYNGNGTERSFVKWLIDSLSQGKQVKVVDDLIGTPTLTDDIANAVERLLEKDVKGTYHVAGQQSLSRLDMAMSTAETFGFDKELIIPVKSTDFNFKAKRPADSSLCVDKLISEGIMMHSFDEGIDFIRRRMNYRNFEYQKN